MPELSIDEWNQIYHEMYQELHDQIARDLMDQRRQDEGSNYEINQAFSELAI